MSTTFRRYAPDQSLLLPPDVRAWLPEGHLASVDGSNPAICGHRKSGHFGRPETAPEFYFKGSCTRKDV